MWMVLGKSTRYETINLESGKMKGRNYGNIVMS